MLRARLYGKGSSCFGYGCRPGKPIQLHEVVFHGEGGCSGGQQLLYAAAHRDGIADPCRDNAELLVERGELALLDGRHLLLQPHSRSIENGGQITGIGALPGK